MKALITPLILVSLTFPGAALSQQLSDVVSVQEYARVLMSESETYYDPPDNDWPYLQWRSDIDREYRDYIEFALPYPPGTDWTIFKAELVIHGDLWQVDGQFVNDKWGPDIYKAQTDRVDLVGLADVNLPPVVAGPIHYVEGSIVRQYMIWDVTPFTIPGERQIYELRVPDAVRDPNVGSVSMTLGSASARLFIWWEHPAVKTVTQNSWGQIKSLYD